MLQRWRWLIFGFLSISGAMFVLASPSRTNLMSSVFAASGPRQATGTVIVVNVSRRVIFVGDNFTVQGFLAQKNGEGVGGMYVTISWAWSSSVSLLTAWDGSFSAKNFSFPLGYPEGLSNITATFATSGMGLLSSSSYVQVRVTYRPSVIIATITPDRGRPSDQVNMTGRLQCCGSVPLPNRTITIQLDDLAIANVTTNSSGSFAYILTIPEGAANGTHSLVALFNSKYDKYASSNATLPLLVEFEATTTMSTPTQSMTEMLLNVNQVVPSGMGLMVSGKVSGTKSGNVSIYLDNVSMGEVNISADGSFQYQSEIPLSTAFGSHNVRAAYDSGQPSVERCEATATIFVLNIPLTALSTVAVLMTSVLIVAVRRKNHLSSKRTPEPATPPSPTRDTRELPQTLKTIPLPSSLSQVQILSQINLEKDYASKVTRVYYLAQDLLSERLGLMPRDDETHREYLDRATKAAPSIKEPLQEVAELFERAEYTTGAMDKDQSRQATRALLRLLREIESRPTQMEQHSI